MKKLLSIILATTALSLAVAPMAYAGVSTDAYIAANPAAGPLSGQIAALEAAVAAGNAAQVAALLQALHAAAATIPGLDLDALHVAVITDVSAQGAGLPATSPVAVAIATAVTVSSQVNPSSSGDVASVSADVIGTDTTLAATTPAATTPGPNLGAGGGGGGGFIPPNQAGSLN